MDLSKMTYEEAKPHILESMNKFVALGWVKIVGKDKKGDPVYEVTERFPFELLELAKKE